MEGNIENVLFKEQRVRFGTQQYCRAGQVRKPESIIVTRKRSNRDRRSVLIEAWSLITRIWV